MSRSNFLVVLALLFLITVPVAVAEAQTPPDPLGSGTGNAIVFDHLGLSDGVVISMSDVSAPPDGMEFVAWLAADDQSSFLSLGTLDVDFRGNVNHIFDSNSANYTGDNLIAAYNGWLISVETAGSNPAEPSSQGVRSEVLSDDATVSIRALLGDMGVLATVQGELDVAITHANLGAAASTLGEVRVHGKHVINVIEGANGPNYDGLELNPGDGMGILTYTEQRDQAAMAAGSAAPDSALAVSAAELILTLGRAEAWVGMARDAALMAVAEDDLAVAKLFLGPGGNSVVSLLEAARDGFDVNGDRTIASDGTEGGVKQAYRAAQVMATLSANAGGLPEIVPVVVPTPLPTPEPTPMPTPEPEPSVMFPGLPGVGDLSVVPIALLALAGSLIAVAAGGVTVATARRRNRL